MGSCGSGSGNVAASPIEREDGLTLGVLAEGSRIPERLRAKGMDEGSATDKSSLFRSAAQRLIQEGCARGDRARAFWVPGRVEVLGKHTDYAGGRSLLAAVCRGFVVVSRDRDDDLCRIFTTFGSEGEKKTAELKVSPELQPVQGHWTAYPAAAIRRFARNFGITKGCDISLECDLPESSGMSSSSAVICYTWLVLAARNNITASPAFLENLKTREELCTFLGFTENGQDCGALKGDRGVGTFGGSEDHTAIMESEAGAMKMYSFCPTRLEGTFKCSPEVTFVIAVSGATAEKTGGAMADYNNAAFLARDAASAWCNGGCKIEKTFVAERANLAEVVGKIREGTPSAGAQELRSALLDGIAPHDDGKQIAPSEESRPYEEGALCRRAAQFFDESEVIIPAAARAMEKGDWQEFGNLCEQSHKLTVSHLLNTIPETAWLPDEARRLGALAASAFGAGFGGSCWALVPVDSAEDFCSRWRTAYLGEFPSRTSSTFFATRPAPGAFQL